MSMPESFKYDVRVRERLLRKGLVADTEIEKHVDALPDLESSAVDIELKQPALQTEAERAQNSVVVRPAPPRPLIIAAPISLDDEFDDDEDDEPVVPKAKPSVAPLAAAKKEPEAAVVAAATEEPAAAADATPEATEEANEDDLDEDEDEEDDDEDDEDEDEEDADAEEGGVGETNDEEPGAPA